MLGFALFGCGRIGRVHAAHIAAQPRARLVTCYDVVREAAASVAASHDASASLSVDAALDDPEVRAVLIASSTDTHVDLLTRAARAGKAVLCEKPIDLDIARVDACWADIGKLAPTVMLGFNRRF
ncbi:MAG: Gfo/Idh/MocA family oxidoreductase, partial [Acetobacteraceae bacterium]|nr:Gfo/Idh/MocA family oxidoreductase [Acetobacteraceae bacterium]